MPAPTDVESIKGVNPDTDEEEARHSSDEEPFAALITCCSILQTNCSSNITGINGVNILSVVSMHLKNTAKSLPIPEDMMELATKYHEALIEAVAEQDEALMEKYFEGEELTVDEIKKTKADFTNKRVCCNLECKSCKWLFI